jgi:hypothetical protein
MKMFPPQLLKRRRRKLRTIRKVVMKLRLKMKKMTEI